MEMTRRDFTVDSVLALLAGCVITVTEIGCDESKTPSAPSAPPPADINGSVAVAANHTHTVTVTGAQIAAGNAVALTLTGSTSHTHTVQLTQSDMTALTNRQAVMHDSTNDSNHMHAVTFTPM
jgi:hypothetical protein